jgi:hypothetical protein
MRDTPSSAQAMELCAIAFVRSAVITWEIFPFQEIVMKTLIASVFALSMLSITAANAAVQIGIGLGGHPHHHRVCEIRHHHRVCFNR